MPYAPIKNAALRLVERLTTAREGVWNPETNRIDVEFETNEAPEDVGLVQCLAPSLTQSPLHDDHEEFLFHDAADKDITSIGAARLLSLGLTASGQGKVTLMTSSGTLDTPGDVVQMQIDAPHGLSSHTLKKTIETAVVALGNGWERKTEAYVKRFPNWNDDVPRDRPGLNFPAHEDIITAVTGQKPTVAYLDSSGDPLTTEEANENSSRIAQVVLRISQKQAALLNQEIGSSIGRSP